MDPEDRENVMFLLHPKQKQYEVGNVHMCDWTWFGVVDKKDIKLTGWYPVAVNIMPQGLYVFLKKEGTSELPVKMLWNMGHDAREFLRSEIKRLKLPIRQNDLYLTDQIVTLR